MLPTALMSSVAMACFAQEEPTSSPIELDALKAYVGVWNAETEVWPDGPDSSSIQFRGVETNRPYGEYWIASDFDSEFTGQTIKVHSIVGYDLDQKTMVGMVIDQGPYAARMTGDYDQDSKTVRWKTVAKAPNGMAIVQKTSVTQKNADERTLVLTVPGKGKDEFIKFMQIRFVKRK